MSRSEIGHGNSGKCEPIEWWREGESNLGRFAGARARRRNPERSDGPAHLWCREGESNPHRAFAPADFKSAASANFAIPARDYSRLPAWGILPAVPTGYPSLAFRIPTIPSGGLYECS